MCIPNYVIKACVRNERLLWTTSVFSVFIWCTVPEYTIPDWISSSINQCGCEHNPHLIGSNYHSRNSAHLHYKNLVTHRPIITLMQHRLNLQHGWNSPEMVSSDQVQLLSGILHWSIITEINHRVPTGSKYVKIDELLAIVLVSSWLMRNSSMFY